MAYVVTENCIRCKYMDCVTVCPVDCFREGDTMLVIDPDVCIDCGVCTPECPAGAIRPDVEDGLRGWAAFNARYAAAWRPIASKGTPPPDAPAWDGVVGKLQSAFGVADPSLA